MPEMPMPLGAARNVRLLVLGTTVPGLQQSEIEEEPAIQRNLDDLLVFDHRAQARAFGGDGGGLRFHRDHRAGLADLHHGVHARPVVNRQHDPALREGLKSLLLGLEPVGARPDRGKFVVAARCRSLVAWLTPVSGLVSVTAAFGIAPPCWSFTVPTSEAFCAAKGRASRNRHTTALTTDRRFFMHNFAPLGRRSARFFVSQY